MEAKSIETILSELAQERSMDVFHASGKYRGRLNHNALQRELQRASKKRISQPTISRFIGGQFPELDTLQVIADGYGMSLNEFLARVRPEAASAPLPALPPEAAELWALWTELPRPLQAHFIEQIKNAIATKKQYPHLMAAISGEALQAANATRVERARKRKQ